jgi:transmembrane sensor
MDELAEKVAEARDQLRVSWSEERSRLVRSGVDAGRRQRIVVRSIAMMSLAVAAAFSIFWMRPKPLVLPTVAKVEPGLRLADGSTATPLDPETLLVTAAAGPDRVLVRLERGRARFSVVHDASRLFRIEVGSVIIEDLGTEFTLARSGDRVRVQVAAGRVRVLWNGGQTELSSGGEGEFPPREASPMVHEVSPPARPAKVTAQRAKWKSLADDGDFDAAYVEMRRSGALHDQPEDLLVAADVARLSHHPAEAVAPLERLVRDHARDPRAPLAAFTLGRVLLEDLGRPREAADAFVEVSRLSPEGPLLPDALAREVEAWSRAGEMGRARSRAEEYLRRFPTGSRVRSVHRYGGLE